MSANSKGVWGVWLQIKAKDLFVGLWVCKLGTQRGHTQSVPEKKEKLGVLTVKSTFLKRISPEFLASGLVHDGNRLPDQPAVWMTDVRWPGYVNILSFVLRWVIGGLSGGCTYTRALTQIPKVRKSKFPG